MPFFRAATYLRLPTAPSTALPDSEAQSELPTEQLAAEAGDAAIAQDKRPILHLYVDESGSRHLDKHTANDHPRWFAIGGILVNAEDEDACKASYGLFLGSWPRVRPPLHMTDMRSEKKNWSWLGKLTDDERTRFWRDYRRFLTGLPVAGAACIVDRPGYHGRGYGARDGDEKWLLCRSAFDIVIERAAKVAVIRGRRLRVFYEGVNPDTDARVEGYFKNLKATGMGFNAANSAKYDPLSAEALAGALIDIERKGKQSKMMQIADSYLYSIAKGSYDRKYDAFRRMLETGRLITSQVPGDQAARLGIKLYCFDHK